jgi:hypothetical protein
LYIRKFQATRNVRIVEGCCIKTACFAVIQLVALLTRIVFAADCLTLVEVMLPKQDVPELLAAITRGVAAINGSNRAAAA